MTGGYIEKGFSPQSSDLEKINSFTRREFDMDSLYIFSIALCNNDIDRDYEKFSVEALNQMKEKFVGKTGIADHSMKSSDQKARIFDTWVERVDGKKTDDGEDFYQLKAKAYIIRFCAVKAYYQIVLADNEDDGITSFKAGDVSYTKDSSSAERAEKMLKLAMRDCGELIKNSSFSFKAV